jgi:hypothetical protein
MLLKGLTQNAANGIGLFSETRHARPCAEKENRFQAVRKNLKMHRLRRARIIQAIITSRNTVPEL